MVDLISGCYILDSASHYLINNSLVARKLPKNALTNLQWNLIDIPELTSVCFVLDLHRNCYFGHSGEENIGSEPPDKPRGHLEFGNRLQTFPCSARFWKTPKWDGHLGDFLRHSFIVIHRNIQT